MITDADGLPLATEVTGANVNDGTRLQPMVEAIPAIRSRRGPRRNKPAKLRADKAYDSAARRQWLRERRISPRIARKGIESKERLGRYRWKVDALGVAKPVSASGAFTVADDAARERAAEAKRSAGSELGARSFYATTLEAEDHAYDARSEWKALAKDYPNEPEIVQRSR